MTGKMMIAAAMLLTSACVTVVPPEGEASTPPTGTCNAAAAQRLVGQPADNDLGFEAQRLTGARSLRWIRPGDAVTMDYRPDRLNIELDERHLVARFRCG